MLTKKTTFFYNNTWVAAKRGVEFRHSTRNNSNSAENGQQSVLTPDSICLPYYIRDTAWSWQKSIFNTKKNIERYLNRQGVITYSMSPGEKLESNKRHKLQHRGEHHGSHNSLYSLYYVHTYITIIKNK